MFVLLLFKERDLIKDKNNTPYFVFLIFITVTVSSYLQIITRSKDKESMRTHGLEILYT